MWDERGANRTSHPFGEVGQRVGLRSRAAKSGCEVGLRSRAAPLRSKSQRSRVANDFSDGGGPHVGQENEERLTIGQSFFMVGLTGFEPATP